MKAISAGEQSNLLYKRWVKRNEQLVEKLSGGRVAYVHVQGMDSPSFRTVYSELLSEKNRTKDAVIVDTRHNGGGWLHDDLVTLLSGKEYQSRGSFLEDSISAVTRSTSGSNRHAFLSVRTITVMLTVSLGYIKSWVLAS